MADSVAKQLETATRRFDLGDAEQAEPERIRSAIRACTQESLESSDGLSVPPKTVRKIFVRRSSEPADAPVPFSTKDGGPR